MSGETTKFVRVTFHKKKTDIMRRKKFETDSEDPCVPNKKDPWRYRK
jgi:hypothetical protein